MEISQDTNNVVNFLDEITNNGLKQKDDLAYLLESWADHGHPDSVIFMIDSGSSLHRVSETIEKAESNPEALEKLKKEEFSFQMAMRINIMAATSQSDKEEYFSGKYRQLTEESYSNLRELAHDFDLLKKLQKTNKEHNLGNTFGKSER